MRRIEQVRRTRRTLERQEGPLDGEPAAKAGERAVGPDHAVARNDDRQRIRTVGKPDRPRTSDDSHVPRELPVRPGLAVGDGAQPFPDRELKRRARRGELQLEAPSLPGEILGKLRPHAREGCRVGNPVHGHLAWRGPALEVHDTQPLGIARQQQRPHRALDLAPVHERLTRHRCMVARQAHQGCSAAPELRSSWLVHRAHAHE